LETIEQYMQILPIWQNRKNLWTNFVIKLKLNLKIKVYLNLSSVKSNTYFLLYLILVQWTNNKLNNLIIIFLRPGISIVGIVMAPNISLARQANVRTVYLFLTVWSKYEERTLSRPGFPPSGPWWRLTSDSLGKPTLEL